MPICLNENIETTALGAAIEYDESHEILKVTERARLYKHKMSYDEESPLDLG